MTRGPRRLKDDSDFQWETGCNIEDEKLVVGEYDLAGLRSRVVAGVLATGAAATTAALVGDGVPVVARAAGWSLAAAAKPILGAAAGAAILASAYWLGMQSGTSEPTDDLVAPITAPAITAPSAGPETSTEVATPNRLAEPIDAAPAATPPSSKLVAPPVSALAPTKMEEVVEQPSGTASAPDDVGSETPVRRAPQSDMPVQEAKSTAAADAMGRGDYAEAERIYTELREWPDGDLIPEATLGVLQARSYNRDYRGAEILAREIQDDPAFSDKREEILRLRAESLVQLDRCTEALRVAEELPVRSAAPTRKSCRGVRREGD